MSQQSIKASCKTNLPSLLQSTFPIWIYLPYWYLTSLLASNHHTNLFTSILYHYSYLTEEPSKPSCIFNLTSLPITPIYYPYLITNLLPLPVSNTPTCITTQHTHTHVHKLIMTDPADPNRSWCSSMTLFLLLSFIKEHTIMYTILDMRHVPCVPAQISLKWKYEKFS